MNNKWIEMIRIVPQLSFKSISKWPIFPCSFHELTVQLLKCAINTCFNEPVEWYYSLGLMTLILLIIMLLMNLRRKNLNAATQLLFIRSILTESTPWQRKSTKMPWNFTWNSFNHRDYARSCWSFIIYDLFIVNISFILM